ncbi:MAG: hypothetical protein ACD_39C01766G0002, partial [uncultured bacterium]
TATGTITGNVLDAAAGTGVAATVTNGTQTTTSSAADGSFTLSNVAVGADGKVKLTVTNASYLTGYAFEPVTAGNTTKTSIYLVNKTGAETDTPADLTAAGETLNFASNVAIDLPEDSVVDASGNLVAAPEVAIVFSAPPTTAASLTAFPGVFAGVPTGATTEVPFETFGFINVDLGAGYQLAEGKAATLTMPIAASLVAAAPATIPLWSFNVTNGKWEQAGIATNTLIGGSRFYVAYPVTHFSWYNLDAPVNVSTLQVVVSSYTSTLNEWEIMEGATEDPSRTDLTKRIAGAKVVVTTTDDSAATDDQWGVTANEGTDNFTRQEAKLTNSNGIASFNIPTGRKFSIKVTTSTGSKSGYMYEVENGVANAYINMGSFASHHGF